MFQKARTVLILGFALVSNLAFSGTGVVLGDPSFTGNGCLPGTSSAALSPDGSTISIIYDNFIANAGGTSGVPMDRKQCIVSIPVTIPPNTKIAITEVDYRGFNALPDRGYTQFTVDFALSGFKGPRILRRFVGPLQADFSAINKLKKPDVRYSQCGQSQVVLNVNANITTVSNGKQEQTSAGVDSTDFNSGLDYVVEVLPCP